MTGPELKRELLALARTVLMLETELRQEHLDEDLIAAIDQRMERGIAIDPRCARLRPAVDALRESTMTPRSELYSDTIRAGEHLRDAIDEVVGTLS